MTYDLEYLEKVRREKQSKILSQAIEKYGVEHQINMAIEEMSELIDVLCKHRRGRATFQEIAEEIADVIIMTKQLRKMLEDVSGSNIVDKKIKFKVDRLERRIKNGDFS